VRIESAGPETESWIEKAGQAGHFDVPTDEPGELSLDSEYVAWLTSNLDFVFQPSAAVCVVVLGCVDVATFEIPVTLLSASEERRFAPVPADHPLPVLDVTLANHDFGELETGGLANLEMPLGNLGRLDVEGTAWVEGGEGAFTVFPAYFQAAPDATDGVMVTWAPTAAGAQSAVLVLESNDPSRPRIEIPLLGEGLAPPGPDAPGGDGESLPVKTCGCAAGAADTGAPLGLVGLVLLVLRRRRR